MTTPRQRTVQEAYASINQFYSKGPSLSSEKRRTLLFGDVQKAVENKVKEIGDFIIKEKAFRGNAAEETFRKVDEVTHNTAVATYKTMITDLYAAEAILQDINHRLIKAMHEVRE